jgi:hypothetical protein
MDEGNWPAVWSHDLLQPVMNDQNSEINLLNTFVAKHKQM